jgi:hypothetical protein
LYRRRKDIDRLNVVDQEANSQKSGSDNEEDDDDDDDDVSWSHDYHVQTLSTIPEVPSTMSGTLTNSAIAELAMAASRIKVQSANDKSSTLTSRDRITAKRFWSVSDRMKTDKNVADKEMHDFRYRHMSSSAQTEADDESNRNGHKQLSSTSSSSTPDSSSTRSPSIDAVVSLSLGSDHQRLKPLSSSLPPDHERKRKRKRCILIVVVVVVVVLVALIAIVVATGKL